MKQRPQLEPSDLRIRDLGDRSLSPVTRRRLAAVGDLDKIAGGEPMALFALVSLEASARISRSAATRVADRRADPEGRWLYWPAEARPAHAPTVAEAVETLAALSAPLPRADLVTVVLVAEGAPSPTDVKGPTFICGVADGVVVIDAVVPKDWAVTADPVSEVDAAAEVFATLLERFAEDPAAPPAAAESLSAAARGFVLGPLAGRRRAYDGFRPVHVRLRESAERFGQRTAYRFENETLAFAKFEAYANGLARILSAASVRRGDAVPVMLRNGLEMPVAYHAVMKRGAIVVPVDYDWPMERLNLTLGQFDGGVILCSLGIEVPPAFADRRVQVCLADIEPSDERVEAEVDPSDSIYGFFTSGTAGAPKCALNSHGALSNRFDAMNRFLGDIGGPVLQNTRYVFDSSIGHMFLPITQGHEVVLPDDSRALDLRYAIDLIARHQVAMTDFVPSVLNQLVAVASRSTEAGEKLASLRELIVGGEQITPKMVAKLRSLLSQEFRVSNCYGITETAIGLTYHPVRDQDRDHIPLGRPLDNCFLVIVDEAMRPLPRGAVGQILVGGECVGNGYRNDEERTRKVFVPNHLPEISGPVLYCTGDRGYFDGQGDLQFVGRTDFLAKVGGVLVELTEVEAVASRMPAVHQAKAFLLENEGGNRVALVAVGEKDLTERRLMRFLRDHLPKAAVPKHVAVLDEMPIAASGKLDQRRLQAVLQAYLSGCGSGRTEVDDAADGPPLEAAILSVFRRACGRRSMGLDDGFFENGGDSLLAVGVALELEDALQVSVSVSDLMECPTARALATRVGALRARGGAAAPVVDSLERDLEQCEAWVPPTFPAGDGASRTVLLTGTTGFVGGYLAAELAQAPGIRVIALCRGEDPDLLQRALTEKGLWRDDFRNRLLTVRGDLARRDLGLSNVDRRRIVKDCDAIVHCGAMVNFVYDYRAHRAANVLGTLELLKLAADGRTRMFHYISTLGVLGSSPEDPTPPGGYSRSKLVAERLVARARENGLDAAIYRLGEIMPSTTGGQPNEQALTHGFLHACVLLRAVPDAPILSDWTPVDIVARFVATRLRCPEGQGRDHLVCCDAPVDLGAALVKNGVALDIVPCDRWIDRLDRVIEMAPERPLKLLRSLLPEDPSDLEARRALSTLFVDYATRFRGRVPTLFDHRDGKVLAAQEQSIKRYAATLLARTSARAGSSEPPNELAPVA